MSFEVGTPVGGPGLRRAGEAGRGGGGGGGLWDGAGWELVLSQTLG